VQDKIGQAVDAYKRAIALNNGHKRVSESAYYLGVLEKSLENYRSSIEYFNLSIEKGKKFEGMMDNWQVAESHYQLIESAYLSRRYRDVLDFSQTALTLFPDNTQNSWAKYMQSDSQLRINEDEKAKKSFKNLAENEPDSIFGKVANATLETMEWKQKHKELFAN
jgi:tetratricopeptide (TPR) repeat protein